MKNSLTAGVLILFSPLTSMAQGTPVDVYTESIITPHFFIAVLAGVLLALGFQFILTALSVAAGITAIGDIKENYVKNKYHPKGKETMHDTDHDDDKDDDDDGMDTGTMITTGFGAWSVITTVLSLFGATALAINLALIANSIIAITLGLVIWATFFILLFYLESKVVNSLVGGLINTATSGLRASGEAVKSMFTSSKETQMKHVAEDTIDKIKKDFGASFDPHVINDSIDEFFTKLNRTVDKKVPDYNKIKKDIKEIIEESDKRYDKTEKEAAREEGKALGKNQKSGGGAGKWMAIQQVMTKAIDQASEGDGNAQNKSKIDQLKKLQSELKEAYSEGDTGEEKLEKIIAKFTPAEEEEVKGYIEKIKQVLSQITPDDMDKNEINLQERIMDIVKNPSVEGPKLASKLGEIDRATIISILEKNTALDKQQLEKYADKAEQLLQKVTGEVKGAADKVTGDNNTADRGRRVSGDLSDGLNVVRKDDSDMKLKLEREISNFMSSGEKPDINFAMLTSYFQNKLGMSGGGGSGDTVANMKRKLKNIDKDSLVAIVTNNTSVEEKDIDKVVQSFEDARNKVLQKVEEVEMEAHRRVENLKRKAIIQAENTRRNAAAAAWWLVASAFLSAGAAIGGSLLAL